MAYREGVLSAQGLRFALVVSRYNERITRALLEGALDTLRRHGAEEAQIEVAWVPGTWEIPVVAAWYARSGAWDAVICLGAVLQGETSHAEHISASVCSTLQALAAETGVPIALGILTGASMEEALERSGGKMGNKGREAALGAIETAQLLKTLDNPKIQQQHMR